MSVPVPAFRNMLINVSNSAVNNLGILSVTVGYLNREIKLLNRMKQLHVSHYQAYKVIRIWDNRGARKT